VRDTHSRLLSLRVLDLISDVFEYLPAVISVASMQQRQQQQHQQQQQQQQQLLEQRAVLLERCSGALQYISMNAATSAGGEFAGVRLMAAVRSFSEGRVGGKTMDEAR
jgi:FtsZ-interacting cell division protein ZipA